MLGPRLARLIGLSLPTRAEGTPHLVAPRPAAPGQLGWQADETPAPLPPPSPRASVLEEPVAPDPPATPPPYSGTSHSPPPITHAKELSNVAPGAPPLQVQPRNAPDEERSEQLPKPPLARQPPSTEPTAIVADAAGGRDLPESTTPPKRRLTRRLRLDDVIAAELISPARLPGQLHEERPRDALRPAPAVLDAGQAVNPPSAEAAHESPVQTQAHPRDADDDAVAPASKTLPVQGAAPTPPPKPPSSPTRLQEDPDLPAAPERPKSEIRRSVPSPDHRPAVRPAKATTSAEVQSPPPQPAPSPSSSIRIEIGRVILSAAEKSSAPQPPKPLLRSPRAHSIPLDWG